MRERTEERGEGRPANEAMKMVHGATIMNRNCSCVCAGERGCLRNQKVCEFEGKAINKSLARWNYALMMKSSGKTMSTDLCPQSQQGSVEGLPGRTHLVTTVVVEAVENLTQCQGHTGARLHHMPDRTKYRRDPERFSWQQEEDLG